MSDLNAYQNEAMSFRLPYADDYYAEVGLAGEVGELLGYFAKAHRDRVGTLDYAHIRKELGDILWFVAAIAEDHGMSLASVAEGNITKLSSRHARGTIQGSGDDR